MTQSRSDLLDVATKYSNMPEESLLFMLGVDVFYEQNPELKKRGVKASAPYLKIGKAYFEERLPDLQRILCDTKNRRPKSKIIESDWLGVAGALMGDLTFGAATAILAILMKNGIIWFCKLDLRGNFSPAKQKSAKKKRKSVGSKR